MIRKMAFVAHPTRNMETAKTFYGEALGLAAGDALPGGKWTEFATPDGAVIALDGFTPDVSDEAGPYMTLESDDIRADTARLKVAGATVMRDVWTNRDEGGDEVCHMALLADPDGNPFMLHQMAEGREG